jgi:hypothetical protein
MSGNPLRARGSVVDALSSALDRGGHGLSNVPVLLHRLLVEESWREFETVRGEQVRYERFADFVATPPLKGLGANLKLVRRIIEAEPDEKVRARTLDLLDAVTQESHGGDRHSESFKLHNIQLEGEGNEGEANERKAPSGTSREAGLRRLRKDRPDLHAEVLAGALSTHAAMVQAGFWRKKITIPVDTPENTALALRRNLTPEAVEELARLLVAE